MCVESGLAGVGPLSAFALGASMLWSATAGAEPLRACGEAPLATVAPGASQAAELDVRRGPGFALVRGARAYVEGACAPGHIARAVLQDLTETVSRTLGVDPALAVVLTSEPGSCSSIFYAALANDVRGIGYQHDDARELFDDTPDSALEGVAFLNDWPYWRERPEEFRGAFAHEVGHRWGARVRARIPAKGDVAEASAGSSALLGREAQHWSYLLDTSGSPLEGNVWVEAPGGFESRTPEYSAQFSELDLYLMGALAQAQVPPLLLLTDVTFDADDCRGQLIGPASPPQSCGSVRARGTALRVSIDDIIAVEGPRQPSPSSAGRTLGVLPIVLESGASALGVASCTELSEALAARLAEFETASSGHVRLENVLGPGEACQAVCDEPEEHADAPGAPVCGFQPRRAETNMPLAALLLLAWVLRRRSPPPA